MRYEILLRRCEANGLQNEVNMKRRSVLVSLNGKPERLLLNNADTLWPVNFLFVESFTMTKRKDYGS